MGRTDAAVKARKPKLIYECFDYKIEQIPHNYRATIKCAYRDHQPSSIDRDYYTHPEHGLEHCKEIVEYQIREHFQSGEAPRVPEQFKAR